jgi:hypothetical protein
MDRILASRNKGDFVNRLLTLLLVFVLGGQFALCQANPEDPYGEKLVSSFVDHPGAPVISMQEKTVNRLGDGAAVGLIRRLGTHPPATPEELQRILTVVKMAFAIPQIIRSEADREPKATLLLLSYLGYLPASASIKGEIEQTRSYVQQQVNDYKFKLVKGKNIS